jgi:hypothetical protein
MTKRLGLVVGLAIATWTSGAWAGSVAQCLRDARSTLKTCRDACTSDFLDTKAGCFNVQTGCFLGCKDGKTECLDDATKPLTDCLAVCDGPLDAARASCKASCGCGGVTDRCGFNPCFIGCMNGPQTIAFQCRDTCRGAFRLNTSAQAALAACRTAFQSCVQACPPR